MAGYWISLCAHQAEPIPHFHPFQHPINPGTKLRALSSFLKIYNAICVFIQTISSCTKLSGIIFIYDFFLMQPMLEWSKGVVWEVGGVGDRANVNQD